MIIPFLITLSKGGIHYLPATRVDVTIINGGSYWENGTERAERTGRIYVSCRSRQTERNGFSFERYKPERFQTKIRERTVRGAGPLYECRPSDSVQIVLGREIQMKSDEVHNFTTLRTSSEGNGGHFRRVVSRNTSFQPCQGWCKTISSSVSVILTIRYHLSCIGWRRRNDTIFR